MLPATALALTARQLRSGLANAIALKEDQIYIGSPKNTVDLIDKTKQNLNLFAYRIDLSGADPGVPSDQPFYVKTYWMITAFGVDECLNGEAGACPSASLTISAGENALRLIGEVMRYLHASPVLSLKDDLNQDIALLEIIFHPLSLDDMNRIWSTQGDTPYRLSVAYEIALLPVPPQVPVDQHTRVSEIAFHTYADIQKAKNAQPPFPELIRYTPPVERIIVDDSLALWQPRICFISNKNELSYILSFPLNFQPGNLAILAAGKPGEFLSLVYEQWDPLTGWKEKGSLGSFKCPSNLIDPDAIVGSQIVKFNNPLNAKGQITFYAQRTLTAQGPGQPGNLRSNPLLLTVYEEVSP